MIRLNDNSLSWFHNIIASFDNYSDDLHNFPSIIKLQIQVIVICEHKIKVFFLNGSLPGSILNQQLLIMEVKI